MMTVFTICEMETKMTAVSRTRECSQEKNTDYVSRQSKRICIPIAQDEYRSIIDDKPAFKAYLDKMITQHPELFPATIAQGYSLQGCMLPSKKMPEVRLRRLAVPSPAGDAPAVFTIAPSCGLPYMIGYPQDVEQALFLRKFGVPYWALARVFGRDPMYWERLELQLGRNSIVGTTIKDPEQLPVQLLADEKHTRLNGEKAYVTSSVGSECVLGASITLNADAQSLQAGYSHFKVEAQDGQPKYAPEIVNTDGWEATR